MSGKRGGAEGKIGGVREVTGSLTGGIRGDSVGLPLAAFTPEAFGNGGGGGGPFLACKRLVLPIAA
eukprot:scaffold503544_cov34-Prasinocladus_malaysianus.AAC.1